MAQQSVALNLKDLLARWIWTTDERTARHYFMFARQGFELNRKVQKATLYISACDKYMLYVNGRYLGRGPQRGDPKWQTYDTYDVTPILKNGRNAIAIQGYRYGVSNSYTRDVPAGLFCRLEIEFQRGKTQVIGTDETWKVWATKGWNRQAKEITGGLGVTEVLDSRLDPTDWKEINCDDSAWSAATVIPRGSEPCPVLLPRDIPMLVEKEVFPKKILALKETLILNRTEVDIPEFLAQEIHQPISHCKIANPQGLLRPTGNPTVVTLPSMARDANVFDGGFNAHILIDFERMMNAFPRIDVEGPAGAVIDMTYGQELIAGRIMPIISGIRCGDRCILRGGRQVWEVAEYKNFRYLQVTVRSAPEPVKIHCVSANTYRYPMTQRGHFICSDPLLTKTWQACVDTTDLCTDDGFMDASVREKRNWLGDGSHGIPAIYAGFGDIALTARYFKMTCWGDLGDGLLRADYPGYSLPHGSGFADTVGGIIPQHPLVWALRFWEHWELFGQRQILEDAFSTLVRLAEWFRRNRDEDGLLAHLPYWNWLDWTPADLRGENLGCNILYMKLLESVANIAEVIGQPEKAPSYRDEAEALKLIMQQRFWDSKRSLFLDSYYKGNLTGVASELGNSFAVIYGIADKRQATRIMAYLAKPKNWIAPVTPLFAYYVMLAYCHVGDRKGLIDFIHRRYGPMMAISDTIWEVWDRYVMRNNLDPSQTNAPDVFPDGVVTPPWSDYQEGWPCSLVHCAGTTAAFVMSAHLLGVQPIGPGFEQCRISPAIDLFDFGDGVFPSVKGDIRVTWKRNGQRRSLQITLPSGLEGELVLPRSVVAERTVKVNGRKVKVSPVNSEVVLPLKARRNEILLA